MKGVYVFLTFLLLPPFLPQLYIFEPISKIVQRFWIYSFLQQIFDKITHIFKGFPFFEVLSPEWGRAVKAQAIRDCLCVCIFVDWA